REAAEGLANALKQWIADHILEYHRGPLHCLNLVNASIERVHRLLQVQPPDFHPEAGRVDNLLAELAAVWADPVLRLTGLFRAAMKPYLEELRTALRYEVNTRLDACVVEAMNPEQADPGLGERLEQLLKVVQLRIRNLMNRVAGTVDALRREYQDRSRRAPIINGICLFDPETTSGGTVPEEYRYGLRAAAGDPALDEQRAQEREAPKLIAEWNTIPQAVTTTGRSWLDQEWDGAKSSEPPLPADDLSGLLSRARRPFKHLREKANCLERWAVRKDREAEAREVARRARPFLTVDQQLDKSNKPIASSRLTLLPENAAYASSFKDAITSEWPEAGESTLPDQVRVVLLNEFYKFPLSVVPEVLGPYGLCQARSEDFPTFHSRTDIRWSGLSDEEVRAAEEAEKLVVIGVLTGVLRPLEGKLVHERQGAAPLGQSARVELPMDFYGAVHELARSDDAKRAVRNAVGLVLQRMSGSSRSEKCVQFIRHIDQMHRQGEGRYIANWPEDNKLAGIVFRYYANDEELRRASRQVYPPDEAQIAELWKEKGAPLPGGRHAPKDGYYCTTCGGPIGETSEEAEQNGWTCQWNEDHYFGPLRLS
ncbi:MAG: hypothetical protein H5T86_08470, partial [Armatimonadetes bacterium]|nr:hypothetical protein [Armatimonadota bacterium]